MSKIGILHPGEMGVSVAASAMQSGHEVFWVSNERSEKTRTRARKHGLVDLKSVAELCKVSEIILCVCPPHGAEDTAKQALENGFKGAYLDANAISPARAINISQIFAAENIHFIDGSIIGPPAWEPNKTRLYLSGERANQIADCFSNGIIGTKIISNEIGQASALKMCYSAYSKGTTALLCAILGTAEFFGVREELYGQWEAGFSEQVNLRVTRVTAKAWRFEDEMKEISATLQQAGLPQEFHNAAAEIYHQLSGFKDAKQPPNLEDVLQILLKSSGV